MPLLFWRKNDSEYSSSWGYIYYVMKSPKEKEVGSEMQAGRPAIIVSNEECNKSSEVVEVVYLTSKHKIDLPTHVPVYSTGRNSTALCEQIQSVSKERLSDKIGSCSDLEMHQIEKALCISLAIEDSSSAQEASDKDLIELREMTIQRDMYKKLYDELLAKLIGK